MAVSCNSGSRPPGLPSLGESPDAGVPGLIAYTSRPASPSGSVCLSVVEASNAKDTELLCDRSFTGAVSWDERGLLRAAAYTDDDGEHEVVVDPSSGRVLERVPGGGFYDGHVRPDGAMLVPGDSGDGAALDVVYSGGVRERVLSLQAKDYRFLRAAWSPDGQWAALVDSAQRLLVVAIDGGTARVLATDVNSVAWGPP